ncbi:MAG TPA: hypothetical protein PKD09_04190 [Aggregatilinea sp.]|jgi:hypothetical protein|nr:hypothetical protein [Aggregatilinea sp.]HML20823.1 hypothetical protein [Aggregatilinea sp.]
MTKKKQPTLAERLQELLESLKGALTPRQLAPVPIPVREDPYRRR